MKRYVFTSLLFVAVGYFVYIAYDAHHFSYRTKLILTISTPAGPIEASGVTQIDVTKSYVNIANTGGHYRDIKGEALIADLGQGRYLFFLPGDWPNLAVEMHAQGIIHGSRELEYQTAIQGQVEPISVPLARVGRMVAFADVTDPTSITGVDAEDLAVTFGAGYALTNVTIQATHDPLSEGRVEQLLGWLRGYEDWLSFTDADGNTQSLGASDFIPKVWE